MEIRRRQLLVAGGAALLAGCSASETSDQPDETQRETDSGSNDDANEREEGGDEPAPLADDLAAVLDVLPAQVDGTEILEVQLSDLSADVPLPGLAGLVGRPSEQLGVAETAVDRRAAAFPGGETSGLITVTAGSFAQNDLALPERAATYTEDGLVVTATRGGGPWKAAIEAARRARGEPNSGLVSMSRSVIRPVQRSQLVYLVRDPGDQSLLADLPAAYADSPVESLAYGQRFMNIRRQEHSFVAKTGDEPDAVETAREVIATAARQNILNLDVQRNEIEYERTDRTVVGSLVGPVPATLQPDNSPDGRFVIDQVDGGSSVLRYTGDEAVSPDRVIFEVDGTARDPPWGQRDDAIRPGETFDLDLAPLRVLRVLWADPEYSGIEQPFGSGATSGEPVLEHRYTYDGTGRLTVTYTGDRPIDASRLTLVVGGQTDRSAERQLDALVGEQLRTGESFTVEDVPPQTSVSVLLKHVTDGRIRSKRGVYRVTAPVPGEFEFTRNDATVTVSYQGDERSANRYQLRRNGTVASTQFTKQYETIAAGDSVSIDAATGDQLGIDWTAGVSTTVTEYTVPPNATFDISYNSETEELTVTMREGDQLDPEKLQLFVAPKTEVGVKESAWQTYQTVSAGDTTTVTLDSDADVSRVGVFYEYTAVVAETEL
jgi:hypothetical protein